jgi:hypothetical protein
MKTVLLRGPVLTQSGYGVHCRQLAKWLFSRPNLKVHCQLLPWGDTPWIIDSNACDGLIGEVMQRSSNISSQYDVTVQLQLPNEWDASLGKHNIGVTAGVETDKCNPAWVDACNKMNHVIVPSLHVKNNLSSHGNLNTKTSIVPESFSDSCLKESTALPTLQDFSTSFNFLIFGQITGNNQHNDRKNTFFTLKWLLEEFKDDTDVGIVLKTNAGRNTLIDKNNVKNILKQVVNEVRTKNGPPVHLLHGEMSDDEVAALYRHPQIKALVALTRGEGYGLPILEAAASGLPVIATGWSGHMDFLSLGKFINVYYQLNEVHPSRVDDRIFMKGSRWANPSEDDFKKRARKFKESSATPKEWAKNLQNTLQTTHSYASISKQYTELLQDVL